MRQERCDRESGERMTSQASAHNNYIGCNRREDSRKKSLLQIVRAVRAVGVWFPAASCRSWVWGNFVPVSEWLYTRKSKRPQGTTL